MNSSNAENEGILTGSQVQALEQAKEEKEAHGEIETPHLGFLLGQDTCYIGYIKGVGKIYQQTAIDTHSNVGFDKVYPDKTALTAANFLNNKVLPFFNFREYGIDSHLNRETMTLSLGKVSTCKRFSLVVHLIINIVFIHLLENNICIV